MKKTITGWISKNKLILLEPLTGVPICIWPNDYDAEKATQVTITYDDGKPATKMVWEWMWLGHDGRWNITAIPRTEAEAADDFRGHQHKKLRSFDVEVECD